MPQFLNLSSLLIAAAATIPPLVALYFLKLKRVVRVVPSTFLWKKSIEDLHVNSPFQRLRKSLLLLLQLLVLIAGALALGVPMCARVEQTDKTLVLMIDQSASMNVIEEDGRSRLAVAKEQAKKVIDDMAPGSRAMVIEFCDRAAVTASFDTDKSALKARIDAIPATQSTSTMAEAFSLAEAYSQNIIIGSEKSGAEKPPESAAPTASVYIYTDGRIRDAGQFAVERLKTEKMEVYAIGERRDNVAILSMDTRRQYERPDMLQVFANLRNFGPDPVDFDAALYINDRFVDNQAVHLEGAAPAIEPSQPKSAKPSAPEASESETPAADAKRPAMPAAPMTGPPAPGSARAVAFDDVEFNEAGTIEVRLQVDDALSADNRAWAIVEPPHSVRVLLVTAGNFLLEQALAALPLELATMLPSQFEKAAAADDPKLVDGDRSRFDVIVMDRCTADKLPQGNYFFWGAAPKIEGVSVGKSIKNERIFDWDDTHPVLRHVPVAAVDAFEWVELSLPPDAVMLMKGQSSPVMAVLNRAASQYLICAFPLIVDDEAGSPMLNTYWVTTPPFIVFLQNAVQFLSSSLLSMGTKSALPGAPVTVPVPQDTQTVDIKRPDQTHDAVPSAGFQTVHYARTRNVGLYKVEPGIPGHDTFAINLFDAVESDVTPRPKLEIGTETVAAQTGEQPTNKPAWPYVLMAMLGVLSLEWVVYNRRVFV